MIANLLVRIIVQLDDHEGVAAFLLPQRRDVEPIVREQRRDARSNRVCPRRRARSWILPRLDRKPVDVGDQHPAGPRDAPVMTADQPPRSAVMRTLFGCASSSSEVFEGVGETSRSAIPASRIRSSSGRSPSDRRRSLCRCHAPRRFGRTIRAARSLRAPAFRRPDREREVRDDTRPPCVSSTGRP